MTCSPLTRVPVVSRSIAVLIILVFGLAWILVQPPGKRDSIGERYTDLVARNRRIDHWVGRGKEAVPELIKIIQTDDSGMRQEAVSALARIGPPAAAAVPTLLQLVDDGHPQISTVATWALAEIGVGLEDAGPTLLEIIRTNPPARQEAARALAQAGPEAAAIILIVADDADPGLRRAAAMVLGSFGPHLGEIPGAEDALRRLSCDSDGRVRHRSVVGMISSGAARPDDFIRFLQDPDREIVFLTLRGLTTIEPQGPEVVRQVAELAPRHDLGDAVTDSLAACGKDASAAAPPLLAAIANAAGPDRLELIQLLLRICPDQTEVIQYLAALVLDEQEPTARPAAELLQELSPETAQGLVAPLKERLRSRRPETRLAAACALIVFDADAVPVVSELILALDDDPDVSEAAAVALRELGPQAASSVPALISVLAARRDQRSSALCYIETLAQIGPGAASAVPLLIEVIETPNPSPRAGAASLSLSTPVVSQSMLRAAAVRALGKIGPVEPAVRNLVWAAASDGRPEVRCAACAAAVDLAADPAEAFPILIEAFGDEHPHVSGIAAWFLGQLRAAPEDIIPLLALRLEDDNPLMRRAVIAALGHYGPQARSAAPQLQTLLTSPRPVRVVGSMTLGMDNLPVPQELAELSRRRLDDLTRESLAQMTLETVSSASP